MTFWKKKAQAVEALPQSAGFFSTEVTGRAQAKIAAKAAIDAMDKISPAQDAMEGVAMDSCADIKRNATGWAGAGGIPDAIVGWYWSQGFIGHRMCAIMAQHWLIDKICTMPARDAVRMGFDIKLDAKDLDEDVTSEIVNDIKAHNKKHKITKKLVEFERLGRVFGVRYAMFLVDSADPEYYVKPYNPDGIRPGSYKGIVQIDPQWVTPELSQAGLSDPTSPDFYEPLYYVIGSKRIHRSHLVIMRNSEVPDHLKPAYRYGGIPVPQKIYERVYAAERTANEGPQLAMTKRLNVLKTDMDEVSRNPEAFYRNLQEWAELRDNYGVKVIGGDEEVQQSDTGLADLDSVIMTQYQLVTAGGGVPATKLLGTTPKGFNSTGEHESDSYHEELESIQTHNLTPLLDRHHEMVMRSEIAPKHKIAPCDVTVSWAALDSPDESEWADINLKKAQTGQILTASGAIDGEDERRRLMDDPDSGYNGLTQPELETDPHADPLADLIAEMEISE